MEIILEQNEKLRNKTIDHNFKFAYDIVYKPYQHDVHTMMPNILVFAHNVNEALGIVILEHDINQNQIFRITETSIDF